MPEPDSTHKPRPVLPSREYIYSVMMAKSHELVVHKGKRCDCKPEPKDN